MKVWITTVHGTFTHICLTQLYAIFQLRWAGMPSSLLETGMSDTWLHLEHLTTIVGLHVLEHHICNNNGWQRASYTCSGFCVRNSQTASSCDSGVR